MGSMIPRDNLTPQQQRRDRRRAEAEQKRRNFRFLLLCTIGVIAVALIVRGIVIKVDESVEFTSADPVPTATPEPDIPKAAEQNDLLKIALNAQGESSKVCYLTFDDGPTTEVTPAVLDILKQYDIKATFFMLGRMIEENPDIAKRVYDEGHLLANHSYSHKYDALYASGDNFMEEIHKTEALIESVIGCKPFKLMRFPGGGHNAGQYGSAKQEYKLLLQNDGYYFADWNALNGDAEGSARSAEQLLARTQETAIADRIVVLMHDASTKQTTADSLPAIIEYLKGQGYTFKRMDEIKYYGGENGENPDASSMIM